MLSLRVGYQCCYTVETGNNTKQKQVTLLDISDYYRAKVASSYLRVSSNLSALNTRVWILFKMHLIIFDRRGFFVKFSFFLKLKFIDKPLIFF